MAGTFISAVLAIPTDMGRVKELAALLDQGVMQIKKSWDSGSTVLSFPLFGDDLDKNADRFRRLVTWSKDKGLPLRAYVSEIDPMRDVDALDGCEEEPENVLNLLKENLDGMKKAGFY